MKGVDSIYNYLLAANIKLNSAQLHIRADNVAVTNFFSPSDRNQNKNFNIDYTITILITDFSDDVSVITYIINEWLAHYQNGHTQDCLSYSTDPLNNNQFDVVYTIKNIKETVTVIESSDVTEVKSNLNDNLIDPVLFS